MSTDEPARAKSNQELGMNGRYPEDPPTFMSSNVRKVLRAANGAKLTAREITTRLGHEAGTIGEPSGFMLNVIRVVTRLHERGEVMNEMPNAERPAVAYWIEPPRE